VLPDGKGLGIHADACYAPSKRVSRRDVAASQGHGGGGEDDDDRPDLDPHRPAGLAPARPGVPFDTTATVFTMIQTFKGRQVTLQDVILYVGEGEQSVQVRFNRRQVSPANLEEIIQGLREGINEEEAPVQIQVRGDCQFGTGQDLQEFAQMAGIELTRANVQQH